MDVSWLVYSLPICLTPGPVNLGMATISAQYGLKNVIPFMLGVQTVNAFFFHMSFFGLDYLISLFPNLYKTLNWMGAFIILYFAMGFLKQKKTENKNLNNGLYKDGILINIFNIKSIMFFSVLVIHANQLNLSRSQTYFYVLVGYLATSLLSQLAWALSGNILSRAFANNYQQISRISFLAMFSVFVWMLSDQL